MYRQHHAHHARDCIYTRLILLLFCPSRPRVMLITKYVHPKLLMLGTNACNQPVMLILRM